MDARKTKSRLELLPLSPDRAIALLSHAAETGNADAAYMLAMIHENGAGVHRDVAASARWLHRAAELNYDRTVEQLSRRCDDLLQHLLGLFDAMTHGYPGNGRRADPDGMRRALEALAESTHDLEMVAAVGRSEERRDTA
jgi:TPR repeat protein